MHCVAGENHCRLITMTIEFYSDAALARQSSSSGYGTGAERELE